MQYIKVTPLGQYTSEQRCIAFSRELFKISRPVSDPDDVSMYLFGWVNKGDEYAMQVDMDYEIYVHPDKNLQFIVSLLNEITTPEEVANITTMIDQATHIRFGDIIPAYVPLSTREDLEAEGWFPEFNMPV